MYAQQVTWRIFIRAPMSAGVDDSRLLRRADAAQLLALMRSCQPSALSASGCQPPSSKCEG